MPESVLEFIEETEHDFAGFLRSVPASLQQKRLFPFVLTNKRTIREWFSAYRADCLRKRHDSTVTPT
ncbi:hypothetical protein D3C80_1115860 [compost metagenome]